MSEDISQKNAKFWDELCGTQLANSLGITDRSRASLKKFDDWYFDFYPYLTDYIPFANLSGKAVLEVGLGYGSVAQKIAESGAIYTGLDIAAGPVEMVNHRIALAGLSGSAIQGSILNPPLPAESFDYIIAIGCLHHTGSLANAIAECHRLLRVGGRLIFMVYYAYSYRRMWHNPKDTFHYFLKEQNGYRGVMGASEERERIAYDANASGEGAPHTDWISERSLKSLTSAFATFSARLENIDNGPPFTRGPSRETLLRTIIPRVCGLDIYVTVQK